MPSESIHNELPLGSASPHSSDLNSSPASFRHLVPALPPTRVLHYRMTTTHSLLTRRWQYSPADRSDRRHRRRRRCTIVSRQSNISLLYLSYPEYVDQWFPDSDCPQYWSYDVLISSVLLLTSSVVPLDCSLPLRLSNYFFFFTQSLHQIFRYLCNGTIQLFFFNYLETFQ